MIVTVMDEIRNLDEEYLSRVWEYRNMAANNELQSDYVEQMIGKISIIYIDACQELIKAAEKGRADIQAVREAANASDKANGIKRAGA